MAKGMAYNASPLTTKARTIINVVDKDIHRRKRRIIAPILSEHSMRAFECSMLQRVAELMQQLKSRSSQIGIIAVTNMSDLCKRLALDVASDIAFGYGLNTLRDDNNRYFFGVFDNWTWRISMQMQFPILKAIGRWFFTIHQVKNELTLRDTVKKIVKKRMDKGHNAFHDLYSLTASQYGLDQQFFHSDLWSKASTLLLAGGGTTAVALSSTVFYLSRYPDCYAKLTEEIRSTFSSVCEIKAGPRLSGCKYLRACIDEALRYNPPVLTPIWRQQDSRDMSG
ncbi:hypothetical protein QQS21_006922 [Conoideocrella luteorostrata]|uniref:Cytochrome P450 n=1 Tax=Conoideocrella luteorostrata TaxID=1105319 RepID=A0AAJ0CR38_9HYPO|nr:hypothetical protein QQS21_006922 [Conoideocrella luteorostrata]